MPRRSAIALICALALVVGLLSPTVSSLKRKNRSFGGTTSLFNPLIVLDEEDQKELGKAGFRYAQQNKIVSRNPILLIPGTSVRFW